MAYAVNFPQCDHLRSITTPNVFASEKAEFIHLNEQLSSLDRHIAELNALRSTLHRRTVQLQNQLLPIYTFPFEVLTYIFQLVVGPESYSSSFQCDQQYIRRALVLSSVSSHFRHVAFGTPELWNRIPLRVAEHKAIDNLSLLQHCIAYASNVTVCVSDKYHNKCGEDVRSVIKTLFTPDTMRKVKKFELWTSNHASLWISNFNSTSFQTIETLIITYKTPQRRWPVFDFGTLNNLTRLHIPGPEHLSITVPPSVQYLQIYKVSLGEFVSLLYQCPNLVECSASVEGGLYRPFSKPLILKYLKRLDTNTVYAITKSSSLQHLQLPSLEFLCLTHRYSDIVPFCCSVSATLTSLTIFTHSGTLDYEGLYQLCRSTFPKLRVLKIDSVYFERVLDAIRALSPLAGEHYNSKPLHLPALESITLRSSSTVVEPRTILDLLKNWWSDEALGLHLELQCVMNSVEDWTPALKEELRLIVGNRQIEISWGDGKI